MYDTAENLGIDRRRVALAGDSAGGLIVYHVPLLRDKAKREKIAQPAAQLLIYPWVSTDITAAGSMESCADMFPLSKATMEMFNANLLPDGKGMIHAWANPLHNENLQNCHPPLLPRRGLIRYAIKAMNMLKR